jgi:hypothetical protein
MAIFHQQWHGENLAKRALSGLDVDGAFLPTGSRRMDEAVNAWDEARRLFVTHSCRYGLVTASLYQELDQKTSAALSGTRLATPDGLNR